MCHLRLIKLFCVIVTLFATKLCVNANINEAGVVETNIGSIRGIRSDEGNFTMFMGIPYAKVNESNIFGVSIPHEPFDEVFDAFDDSAICPQIEEFNFTIVGSLDCLHLNVYVPDSASSQNLLPVMVYIYGGGFNIGFAGRYLYGPDYIVRHDVILVTLNYRLGPYGFMCLDIPEVPGNAGLKDQVIALRWIQNNIEWFGGDPSKVTLFGNSAGGISSAFHLLSENEKLFTNLIMQSGPLYYPGMIKNPNHDLPLALAAALNFETNDILEALSFLSEADVYSVIAAASALSVSPCIEDEFPGVERFLGELPINSKFPKAPGVAIMLGYNSEEALILFPENAGPGLWSTWETTMNSLLQSGFTFDQTQMVENTQFLRMFYLGDEEINNNVRQQVLDYISDLNFVYPTIRSIEPFLEAGVEKVYQYLFSYDGNRNFVKVKDNITMPGCSHADEIGYQFKMEFIPEDPSEDDQLIIDRITAMWTNFAKYRDPTPEINSLLPVKWEPVTLGTPYHYMNIDSEMTSRMRYETRRMTFLDLFHKAYRQYEIGYINNDDDDDGTEVPDTTPAPDSSALVFVHPILVSATILLLLNTFLY